MELRELECFAAVAREGSISAAAETMGMSQPNLSRMMASLERDLGASLFVRGSRRVELTEEGRVLRRRALELLELAQMAREEVSETSSAVAGTVRIDAGETDAFRLVCEAMVSLRRSHPGVRFQVHSGNAADVIDRLDRGLTDFGIVIEPADKSRYEHVGLPASVGWGALVRSDDPLADRASVGPRDLDGRDLIVSQQDGALNGIAGWMGRDPSDSVVATYNLLYNASLMVSEGLGTALCLEGIADTSPGSGLRFLPLDPPLEAGMAMIWRRGVVQGRAQRLFLEGMRSAMAVRDGLKPSGPHGSGRSGCRIRRSCSRGSSSPSSASCAWPWAYPPCRPSAPTC